MSSEINKKTLRRLIDQHREAGAIPVAVLEDLLKVEPKRLESDSGLYVVRQYDGFDHDWIDISEAIPWDKAVELWNRETDYGSRNVCFSDIDYYAIYPADTRMVFSADNVQAPEN